MTADGSATFVLEFSYPADKYLQPIQDVVETYMHVLGLTTVKPDIVKGMLPLWLHGHQKGDIRLQEAALGPLRSPDVSFAWPWFIEWVEHFREAKLVPRAWEPFADLLKDRHRGFRDERVPLLADVIWRTVSSRLEAQQHAKPIQLNGAQRHYVYDLVPDCEASESLVRSRLERLVPGDWRTYPPYFPGDRTRVERKGSWR